jgi:hypothetical protein
MVQINWLPNLFRLSNSTVDQIGGIPLINCPEPDTTLGPDGRFPYPTILFTFMITGLIGFSFAILIAAKYNSVRVFNKKIRTNEISNTLWILFYLFIGIRSVFDSVRYGLDVVNDNSNENSGLFMSSLVTDSLATLFLTLSLHHQLKYRSPAKILGNSQRDGSGMKQRESNRSMRNADRRTDEQPNFRFPFPLFSVESIYFVLFVLNLVFLYLNITNYEGKKDAFYWLYFSGFILQRIPVVILTFFVMFSYTNSDGPSAWARNFLFLGTFCYIGIFAPPSILTEWFTQTGCTTDCPEVCPFYIGTWVDFLQWLQIIAYGLYMLFIRSEYIRNMEECIWTTVTQIQDTFDYKM